MLWIAWITRALTPERTSQHPTESGRARKPVFEPYLARKFSLPRQARLAIVRRAQKLALFFPGENGAPPMLLDRIKDFALHYFTWWNGANFNTRFYTKRFGVLVGHDEFGNTYYRGRASIRRSASSGGG